MGEEEKAKEAAAEKGTEPAPAAVAVAEEEKKGDGGAGAEGEKEDAAPPPPEEVVMRVFMHCEGCARKVKRILKGFDGVEDVSADSKAHKVVVKGKKAAADPMKVVERVQKKTSRKVELLSPLPPPPNEEEKKEEEKKEEPAEPAPKPEEKKEKPKVVSVVLKVHMHCEACAQVLKKKILKMKGVESAEPDLKASQITVKGVFEEAKLADYVHRRTGKHAVIVKSEPVVAENAGDGKDDKKADEGGEKKDDSKEEKKDSGEADKQKDESNAAAGEENDPLAMANPYMHYPRFNHPSGYGAPGYTYQHAPQLFSDENPNACSVM